MLQKVYKSLLVHSCVSLSAVWRPVRGEKLVCAASLLIMARSFSSPPPSRRRHTSPAHCSGNTTCGGIELSTNLREVVQCPLSAKIRLASKDP